MKDLWGRALLDYYHGAFNNTLILHTSFGEPEDVPVWVFFREQEHFEEHELLALDQCRGRVLDIGAGTGCHSLYLQEHGVPVTALEQSSGACEVMRSLGVHHVVEQDLFSFNQGIYDTALILMNGLGLAGTLNNLPAFLNHIMSLLKPGGQILADSCDVRYLYSKQQMPKDSYYGEQRYSYQYDDQRDVEFSWLFVDMERLQAEARRIGLTAQIVYQSEAQYLARITRS